MGAEKKTKITHVRKVKISFFYCAKVVLLFILFNFFFISECKIPTDTLYIIFFFQYQYTSILALGFCPNGNNSQILLVREAVVFELSAFSKRLAIALRLYLMA